MLSLNDDFGDLKQRLQALGYAPSREDDERAVQALVAIYLTLESFELPEDARDAVLDLLSREGRHELGSLPRITEDSWQDFDYGNVKINDFVRVKLDAYDSESGSRHNGLVGILTAMSGGNCSVRYIGRATGSNMRHPMGKLDSLKRV